ncbi:riboflavin kinase [Frondihabitans australicus]|uniref:Bifunctional riboflavin kinase/FMN adenylyltransferase n=1 Tax=Frondihabitans australicus TaxID=386892 RepID=A0A495IM27_9MICO|nr:riboflavin kinase [Frondihabitans australicus]RKR76478.1 riboflavin kinase/FMN adenylyltransferase [Frondihabitans australicus]
MSLPLIDTSPTSTSVGARRGAGLRTVADLTRYPSVRGEVVHGEMRGRELGFPTANMAQDAVGTVPEDGVYAARVIIEGRLYDAAVSVGDNPTFEGVPARQIEAYLLDVSLDLYGKQMAVYFVERIRGNVRFEGLESLVAQIAADVENVRHRLAA